MATALKIPKGILISKETIALLSSAAFIARVKARAEAIKVSKVEAGFFPDDGNLQWKVISFNILPKAKDQGRGAIYADDYLIFCEIADSSHRDDGKRFTQRFRVFIDDKTNQAKRKAEKRDAFSMGAGELKLMLTAVLGDEDKVQADDERNWPKILLEIVKAGIIFRGRCWTSERTDEESGRRYTDTHLRTFGLLEAQEEAGTEAAEEAPPGEVEAPEEEEEETGDEADEEEASEAGEEVELEIGSVVTVEHPTRGDIEVTVTEINEDDGTFNGTFLADGKKLKPKVPFKLLDIKAVEAAEA